MHLFAGSRLLGAAPTETRNADAEVAQYATESPPTDLMALAGARVGVAPPFVATIMRAFRRACPLQCPDRQTMLAMKSWETNWRCVHTRRFVWVPLPSLIKRLAWGTICSPPLPN